MPDEVAMAALSVKRKAQAEHREKFGNPKRLNKLNEVNKWRKEMGLELYKPSWTLGRNRTFNAKYGYEKQMYKYAVQKRDAAAAIQHSQARALTTRSRVLGPSPSSSASGSNGGNISNYRRIGKTSLIQRALQTGNSPQTGISVPK